MDINYRRLSLVLLIFIILLLIFNYVILNFSIRNIAYTGSMKPLLDGYDKVIMKHTNNGCEGLRIGDIVTFKYDDGFIIHRVQKINDDNTFLAKGDNNFFGDPVMNCSEIVGKSIIIITNI